MSSFADCPLEVIEVVIDLLQDGLDALKACSQTCTALLPLSRKYIFRSLLLVTSSEPIDYPIYQSRSPSSLRLTVVRLQFWHFLDTNPTISEYVHTFVCHINFNDDIPRVLERLHHVRSFKMINEVFTKGWKKLSPHLRDTLLRVVQSHFITCLAISFACFPITAFLACVNLTDLSVSCVDFDSTGVLDDPALISSNLDLEVSEVRVPRLQVFTYGFMGGKYAMRLLNAKVPNGGPMLDFTNVRTLSVYVEEHSDLAVVHALVNATNKLETLRYDLEDFIDGYGSIALSTNKPSLSTLKRLHLSYEFDAHGDAIDFVCGMREELGILSGLPNVIEEIAIEARILIYGWGDLCRVWGMLDTVLSNGFPTLRHFSLNIQASIESDGVTEVRVKEELDEIPAYLPLLSNTATVLFSFSARVIT